MKVYLVIDHYEGTDSRVFIFKNRARKFILNSYSKFLELNEDLRKNWASLEEAKTYIKYVDGIEDFAYIEKVKLGKTKNIKWFA